MSYSDDDFESYESDFESFDESDESPEPSSTQSHLQKMMDKENASFTSPSSSSSQPRSIVQPFKFTFSTPNPLSKQKQSEILEKYRTITSILSFETSHPITLFSCNLSRPTNSISTQSLGSSNDVFSTVSSSTLGLHTSEVMDCFVNSDDEIEGDEVKQSKTTFKIFNYDKLVTFLNVLVKPLTVILERNYKENSVELKSNEISKIHDFYGNLDCFSFCQSLNIVGFGLTNQNCEILIFDLSDVSSFSIKLPCPVFKFLIIPCLSNFYDYFIIGTSSDGMVFCFTVVDGTLSHSVKGSFEVGKSLDLNTIGSVVDIELVSNNPNNVEFGILTDFEFFSFYNLEFSSDHSAITNVLSLFKGIPCRFNYIKESKAETVRKVGSQCFEFCTCYLKNSNKPIYVIAKNFKIYSQLLPGSAMDFAEFPIPKKFSYSDRSPVKLVTNPICPEFFSLFHIFRFLSILFFHQLLFGLTP
ncbi:hypothetical protein GEMRC1_005723 [Eukaryota sp. GEM-RC1]